DYINTDGTSTPGGDVAELRAIGAGVGDNIPPISSTKSLTGDALGAAGVHEAIYSSLMVQNSFSTASANISQPDEVAAGYPIVTTMQERPVNQVLSNSFGFGGTNASLVLKKYEA